MQSFLQEDKMSKHHEEEVSSVAQTSTPIQHKMNKKEREREQELEREAKAKLNGKSHHKKHGNC